MLILVRRMHGKSRANILLMYAVDLATGSIQRETLTTFQAHAIIARDHDGLEIANPNDFALDDVQPHGLGKPQTEVLILHLLNAKLKKPLSSPMCVLPNAR